MMYDNEINRDEHYDEGNRMSTIAWRCGDLLEANGFKELKTSIPSFRPYLLSKYNEKFYSDEYKEFKLDNPCIDIYYNKQLKVYATLNVDTEVISFEYRSDNNEAYLGYFDVVENIDVHWLFGDWRKRTNDTDRGIMEDVCCERDGDGCYHDTNLYWAIDTNLIRNGRNLLVWVKDSGDFERRIEKIGRSKYMIVK
tara:strand:+ start:8304 stop:8891 length:588 start_codon:yes stop_codon:yes gene_type:complete